MIDLMTLKGRLIGGGIAALVLAALLTAFWAIAWGKGYRAGALSNAEPLAVCETSLATIKETQDALDAAYRSNQQRLAEISADRDLAWRTARDAAAVKPRVIRVRDAIAGSCTTEQMRVPNAAEESVAAAEEPGLGTPGVTTLTIAEIERRLNNAEQDAAQLAHLIAWIEATK